MGILKSLLVLVLLTSTANADWLVKQTRNVDQTVSVDEILDLKTTSSGKEKLILSLPEYFAEGEKPSDTRYEEVIYSNDKMPGALLIQQKLQLTTKPLWKGSEVRTLVNQGPPENRINLTFVGDGYTTEEKEKYFKDVERLTKDLFGETTFASYLPLFNVYAVFVPSQESGITDTTRKNTALGLYRAPKGSKRGVMPGNRSAIERALRLTGRRTDYPILVANDDFYGGLGGRYAITTRSENSGSMVLRHELGHNFGNVGEEYDGGWVYQGANHSSSSRVKWARWVEGEQKTSEYKVLKGAYVWENLRNNPVTVDFNFPRPNRAGNYLLHIMLSSVGWASSEDVHVFLDGLRVKYDGVFTKDRSFFDIGPIRKVEPGKHSLFLREALPDRDNVMAFARVYAISADYDFTPNRVGAFSTFNANRSKVGYRPTHKTCLMRDMRSKKFCAPDQENMWVRFLGRVSLIDEVKINSNGEVELHTPDIEDLKISWYKIEGTSKTELVEHRNQKSWEAKTLKAGTYRVEVEFISPEVRISKPQFKVTKDFRI